MAANPIYIETEEEIPEVIERVRLSTAEDTTLVLPTRSRFGQSRFNFQLLRQYASGMGKRVAIVSPDPAVQQMAEEHGFRSYRAVELVGGEAEPQSGAAASAAGAAAAAERPLPLPPARPAAGVAPPPRMVMGAPARLPSRLATEMRPGHTLLYAGAGLLLIAGLVAGFIYVPAADITLTASATSFEQPVTVDAQPGQPPVRVRAAKVEKTASGAFKATGTQKVPGVLATGSVVFTNACGGGLDLPLPDGYRLIGTGGIEFMVVGAVTVPDGKSTPAPIKATSPGVSSNLPAGSITTLKHGPNCLTVTNPAPTSGGVDDKTNTIIQPSDLDTARQGLEAQLRKDIGDDLARGLQPGEKLAESPLFSPPDFNPDHKLGDVVTGFNATLKLSAEGAYYNEADVQKAFADGLARKVPADKSLTDNRVAANYTVDQGSGAHMTFRGTARSFLAPRIDFNRLSGQLAAKSTGQARAVLGKLPVESADLKQTPVRLPFMPLSSSRIHIRYVVEQGAAPAASPAPRKSP